MIDFDEWRRTYPKTSYEGHLKFYEAAYAAYPEQIHFDLAAAKKFFTGVGSVRVAEVGGWRGELAAEILANHPEIVSWENVEIAQGAVDNTRCLDPRYSASVPDRWVWQLPPDTAEVLVLSHVIEHMKANEVAKLIDRYVDVQRVFIASPLPDGPPDWSGYQGTHIIEVGWMGVDKIMALRGLFPLPALATTEVRCYQRLSPSPKVSLVVTTYNRTSLLMERAIPSILAQTNPDWECHVVGDGTQVSTTRAMRELMSRDPRFRYTNLKHSKIGDWWGLRGLEALNYGLDHAGGDYLGVLADDDAFYDTHNQILLDAFNKHDVDFIYGKSRTPRGQVYGSWPPGDGALTNGSYLYRGKARAFRYDPQCQSARGRTGDADMWIRMREAGVTFEHINDLVHWYYPSAESTWPATEEPPVSFFKRFMIERGWAR